jgi:hypothetical protein
MEARASSIESIRVASRLTESDALQAISLAAIRKIATDVEA